MKPFTVIRRFTANSPGRTVRGTLRKSALPQLTFPQGALPQRSCCRWRCRGAINPRSIQPLQRHKPRSPQASNPATAGTPQPVTAWARRSGFAVSLPALRPGISAKASREGCLSFIQPFRCAPGSREFGNPGNFPQLFISFHFPNFFCLRPFCRLPMSGMSKKWTK